VQKAIIVNEVRYQFFFLTFSDFSDRGFRGFGSLESLGRMKMTSARSTVFQAFFLTIFWAIAVIVGLFVWESRDLLSKIPKDDEFVNLLSISRYIYVMKSLLCFFVVVSYVHFLSLMREVPAIGGPVSAILYTIVDLKLLVCLRCLFGFGLAIIFLADICHSALYFQYRDFYCPIHRFPR
jgi:hypothetical protein